MNGNRVNGITCKTRNVEWNAMQSGTWNGLECGMEHGRDVNVISPRQRLIGVGINWGEH